MGDPAYLDVVGAARRYPMGRVRARRRQWERVPHGEPPPDAAGRVVAAVVDATLSCAKGELTALLGESGSGKTTLLRLIAGFEPLDAGTISIAGALVADARRSAPPEQRSVGMVFQQTALLPHLNIRRNIGFGLRQLRAEARDRRVDELVELAGIGQIAHRYPHEISGGQAQRAALARALAPSPNLLLLDEPFNNLDSALKWPLIAELRRLLVQTGTTALFVTHERDEAFAFADRIAVLHKGSIEQTGAPEALYAAPASDFVASYLGTTNLIQVREIDGGTRPAGVLAALGALNGRHTLSTAGGLAVSIRPSELELNVVGADGSGVRGQIAALRFRGERREVTVNVEGVTLTVYVPPVRRLAVGDAVVVTLRADG
jgi:iron(III) transport system ATP-binding protein